MNKRTIALLMIAAVMVVLFVACGKESPAPPAAVTVDPVRLQLFLPLPAAVPSPANPLSDDKVKSIATYMKALTGEIPAEYIKQPVLPKSTSKTPKAEID